MKYVIGYTDSYSVAPGGALEFKISAEGAASYDVEIVRMCNAATGKRGSPLATPKIGAAVDGTYPARRQRAYPGSYGVVEAGAKFDRLSSFTLQACIFPTLPKSGVQAIMGTWSPEHRTGIGLELDADGRLTLRMGDGNRSFSLGLDIGVAPRKWHLVAATFDAATGQAALHQIPISSADLLDEAEACAKDVTDLRPYSGGDIFAFAAWPRREAGVRRFESFFDGKIDRPRIANTALDRAAILALNGTVRLPADPRVVAAWDFAADMTSRRIRDTSPGKLDGELFNQPMRAVTGHNWAGTSHAWMEAPDEYGAIYFHSDDLADVRWDTDFTFDVPADMKSGVYAAKLSLGDFVFHLPFFVRPPAGKPAAKLALLMSTATYTVYGNQRSRYLSSFPELSQGRLTAMDPLDELLLEMPELGASCYDKHKDGSGVIYVTRNRPLTNLKPIGRHFNFNGDLFLVEWLDRMGIEYDVITDDDLDQEGIELLQGYSCVMTCSHPEYYSLEMLDALTVFAKRGGRLMYMGGNGFYWRVSYHRDNRDVLELRRTENGARSWAVMPGEHFHSTTGELGGLWRNQRRPPQMLTGVGYVSYGFDTCSYFRRMPDSNDPRAAFIFDGIDDEIIGDFGLCDGGAAGYELDCVDYAHGSPAHALVLARSENHSNVYELTGEEVLMPHPATDAPQNKRVHADIAFFETQGGGAVFSTGSISWSGSLPWNDCDNNVSRLTKNVLLRFLDPTPFVPPARKV